MAWLAGTLCLYWLSPGGLRQYFLVISTILVLAYADTTSLLMLASMTAIVCIATQARGRFEHMALGWAGATILLALVLFKLFQPASLEPTLEGRVIPLGLSFYSLRCIHVILERYLGQIPRPRVAQILQYLFFPATIVAGPIHRYPAFISDAADALNPKSLMEGLERILYGYVKIIVISNYFLTTQIIPRLTVGMEQSSAAYQYLDALSYGLNLYFQFSGYSDIAIGFAQLLGHRIIENFSWPLFRPNIVSFWQSWHISLTSFCREYVFSSVFARTRKAWAGVFATMLAVSLWHGLTFNYLAWGLYHATGLVVFQRWTRCELAEYLNSRLPQGVRLFIGWLITFQFVMIGFIWTKEVSLEASIKAFLVLITAVVPYV